jgi:uncharacterized protein YjdB
LGVNTILAENCAFLIFFITFDASISQILYFRTINLITMKKLLLLFATVLLWMSAASVRAAETPPSGYVSLYSLTYVSIGQTDQTGTVSAVTSKQLVGPGSGWNSGTNYYDISKYSKLAIKLTFDAADAGRQVAVRIAFSKTTIVTPFIITYPTDGSTSMVYEIDLTGKTSIDGMYFYNGSAANGVTYTAASTKAVTINYVALKTIAPTAMKVAALDTAYAAALPYGLTTTLKPEFTPTNTTNTSVTWESLNPTIATVNASGVVTAGITTAGTATIKATSVENTALSATYDVNVLAIITPVASLQITQDTVNLKMLNTKQLTYTVLPALATNKKVIWTTTNADVAKVDTLGIVTPVGGGSAYIIGTTFDGAFVDTCVVNITGFLPIPSGYVSLYSLKYNESGTEKPLSENLTSLGAVIPAIVTSNGGSILGTAAEWNRYNKYVDLKKYNYLKIACTFKKEDVGKTIEFRNAFSKLSGVDAAGSTITNKTVTIASENMSFDIDLNAYVGDVDNLRRLGALKFRNTTSGTILFNIDYVAVQTIPVTGVAITDSAVVLEVGKTKTLAYSVSPSVVTNDSLTWTSSNASIATVVDGVVTGVGKGTALIKGASKENPTLMDSCFVTVTKYPTDWTSLYSLTYQNNTQTDQTGTVAAVGSKLLVGPSSGWGSGDQFYDISKYDTLGIKITFDTIDINKHVIFRIAWDKAGVSLYNITLPANSPVVNESTRSYIFKVSLLGKKHLDGMSYYNGGTGYFTYEGAPTTKAGTVEYVALKSAIATGVKVAAVDTVLAAALPIRSTTTLKAVFTPILNNNSVTWLSSDSTIATVNASGLVKGVKAGTATITAKSVSFPTLSATYDVNVIFVPVTSVNIVDSAITVEIGKTKTLTYSLLPLAPTNDTIKWSSSDTTVAKVVNGVVTAIKKGTALIKVAALSDSTKMDSCFVTVTPWPTNYVNLYSLTYQTVGQSDLTGSAVAGASSLQLVGQSSGWGDGIHFYDIAAYDTLLIKLTYDTLNVGKQGAFRAAWNTAGPYAVVPMMFTYPTKNTAGVTMPNDSCLSFVYKIALAGKNHLDGMYFYNGASHGSLTYTAAATKSSIIEYVALQKVTATGLSVTALDATLAGALPTGSTTTLKAVFTPAVNNNTVTWESLDTNIATVDANGVVTAVASTGTVAIKATSVTFPTLSATYNVTVIPLVAVKTVNADNPNALVNVYSITGTMIRKSVKTSEATVGLEKGLYIVGNKKVLVTK